ncbi:MAG: PQQ-binding-like beta-propeller repeat protein [Thermoplasmata archaeon]|nr:PQQ-binding-like beta-propeller repeat protein [Thermoplasmata archaeon]
MYCHDTHHTGRSPYSTADNPPGILKWIFETHHFSLYGSTVIDSDGIIYTAANDLYAIYPNGTMKWQFALDLRGDSCPAIDSNGTIYVASAYGDHNYIYALYPNGSMKWRYYTGNDIFSSPAIGSDGTIYCGCGQSILALFPNGTLRWQHSTNHVVYSSPAIGDDGTVYCGCHDTYLYALYPNNGTVKWMFKTGDWIRVSPCIADDGTIYCVSTDGYLYAIRENGTMKWRTWVEAGTSPTIGQDGTIYAGWSQLYAVNPVNGSVKWIFNSSGAIQGGTPCNSLDGTIYFGTISGYLIAVNPNGTEQWRAPIGQCESAPAIGEDGTIYIGSMDGNGYGYLNAFGPGEPKKIEIQQPEPGKLYLFGLGMGNTLSGNTVIIGSVKVKVHAYSWNEIESVHFYIDGADQYNITIPPFEWNMNQRYGKLFPLRHTITVTAFYKGGCEWSESIDVMYFHLLKN